MQIWPRLIFFHNMQHRWKYFLFFFILLLTACSSLQREEALFVKTFGPDKSPMLDEKNTVEYFESHPDFPRGKTVFLDPTALPAPITRKYSERVEITIEARELIAELAPGVQYPFWTFNGTVPGPFLRVREGDTMVLTFKNHEKNLHDHNIDLHAVNGPGGGGAVTNVKPGESKTFQFKALNPGLYVYHCAHPNHAVHMANGMYGLILVEPKVGLPRVDQEFYIMQGEWYPTGLLGSPGLQVFDPEKLLKGAPEYITFNGHTPNADGSLSSETGKRIRIYIGNGGVNLISSFHIIGEIFDVVYPEGAIGSAPHQNVQTTLIPAGGATIVDFQLEVPGTYVLVDHALARLDRGAWMLLNVVGKENPGIFSGEKGNHEHSMKE